MYDGCSRAMTHLTHPTHMARGPGQELFIAGLNRVGPGGVRNLAGRVGSDQKVSIRHALSRVTLARSDPLQVSRLVKKNAVNIIFMGSKTFNADAKTPRSTFH